MKQRSLRPKKRGTQVSAPKDLSDIGVDKVHYNPADDFFVVSQENLGGAHFQPAAKRRKRRPAAKSRVRGAGPLGGFFLLLLGACVALPALTLTSSPSLDTSAVVIPGSGADAGAAEAARAAEIARQEAAAAGAHREQLEAQEAAAAAHDAQVRAAAAERARLDAVAARDETAEYENCTDVWNRLGRAIDSTDPGYSAKLDRDGDGTGCESKPSR